MNSDTQSKVWDELEGVVADISRGVKDVALKNSIDSAKLAVAKNATSKKGNLTILYEYKYRYICDKTIVDD